MTVIVIKKRQRKRIVVKNTATAKPVEPAPVEDKPLVFDDRINVLVVELANHPQGMQYDFCNVEPHRSLRLLEEAGLVEIRKHTSRTWSAVLTTPGKDYLGVTLMRRRRRRRNK